VKTNLTWFGWVKYVFMLSMLLPAPVAGRKAEAFHPAPAQTEVMLPAPTGPHKTGRASFHWKDSERAELETSALDDKRELEDVLKVEEGSLYPALYRMEEQGWIEAEWGASENNRRAKYYKLTRAGRKQLSVETSNWERLSEAIARVLRTA
jgi:transcriptional regulator